MKKILVLACLMGIMPVAMAQTVKFTANAPNMVKVGDQFEVVFSVNADPSDIHYPDFQDFRYLYGPSVSQSIEVVNGRTSQSVDYTYALEAIKAGKFTIAAAEITVKGKKIKSNPITIEVVAGKNKSASTSGTPSTADASNTGAADGDIFLRVNLEKSKVIQGECLVATVRLYSKVEIAQLNKFTLPEFDGFYKQEVDIPQQGGVKKENANINGEIYNSYLLKKFILVPQKSGDIKIEPSNIELTVARTSKKRSRGFYDNFFGPSVEYVPVKLQSKSVTLHVSPLPDGKPESFNGSVGRFTMVAQVDKKSVKTNEPISLKVTLSGNGNIKLLEAPKISFPPDFDTYDPKVTVSGNPTDGGISGSKTFEYLIIPRNPGEFQIPAVKFTYFDVTLNQYKTITSSVFDLNVQKGTESQSSNVVSGFSKEDIKFVGKDILFIKTETAGLQPKNSFFSCSIWHWLSYVLSLLIFSSIIFIRRQLIKQNANIALMKNRRADKYTSRRLKQASIYLKANQKEQFYEEMVRALWGYLSDKLSIPLSELSRDTIRSFFEQKGIETDITLQFVELVDNCEYARYAPVSADISMKGDYDKAVDLITKLQQKLR